MAPAEQDRTPPLSFLRYMASAFTSRMNLSRRAGLSFEGERDMYAALGYDRLLGPEKYRDRYDRNGVATRIVTTYPKSTWRGVGLLVDDQDPTNETEFEAAWLALDKRLKIWPQFKRTDILAGLGDFSILVLGLSDGGDLEQPIPDAFTADELIFLRSFSQKDVDVKSLVADASNPRFGEPELYTVDIGRGTNESGQARIAMPERTVHWSRVIHVADGILDDEVNGMPRLENVWNFLDDLDKIVGGGAEAFWLRAHQGYVASLDKDMKLTQPDIDDIKEQVEEFAHQMRRTIGQRGVDFQALGSDVADIGGNVDAMFDVLSASTGIPKRILMGSERGELASTQDKTNFDDRVQDRRDDYAEPQVVRPFVDRLIEHGALPEPVDGEYEVRWPEIDALDETAKAGLAVKLSVVNKNMGEVVVTPDEIRERALQLPPLEDVVDDVDEIDDDMTPAPPDPDDEDDEESEPVAASGKGTRSRKPNQAPTPSPSGEPSIEPLMRTSPSSFVL